MRSFVSLAVLALFAAVPASAAVPGCGLDECNATNRCKVLLCANLDSAVETVMPVIGPQASSLTTFDFVKGVVERGMRANAVGEYAAYPQIGRNQKGTTVRSIENTRGTLDFWYQPSYDETDPGEYFIITNGARHVVSGTVVPKAGSMEILKHSSLGNGNALAINYWDGVATERLASGQVIPKRWEFWIYPADYELKAGVFTNFRITWDWSSSGVPLRVWQDSRELPLQRADGGRPWTGPMGVVAESAKESLFICGRPTGTGGQLFKTNGVCDEVRVYDQPLVPPIYCGLGPELAVVLPFLAWAHSRRRRRNA